eukprot:283414-Prymnesium_polylepis.1
MLASPVLRSISSGPRSKTEKSKDPRTVSRVSPRTRRSSLDVRILVTSLFALRLSRRLAARGCRAAPAARASAG